MVRWGEVWCGTAGAVSYSVVALIPARAGSQRVLGKNIRELGGRPLFAWTIQAARASGVFDDIYISTDSEEIGQLAANQYGAVWISRPVLYATAESPDIEWVQHALTWMAARDLKPAIMSILRPTSPFRDAATIRAVMARFLELAEHPAESRPDSLRCIRLATEHPAKIWSWSGDLSPMLPYWAATITAAPGEYATPAHSRPTQTLPPAYVQTAGMELVWREAVERTGTISGERIHGYLLEGPAALDINTAADWDMAEQMIEPSNGPIEITSPLPPIRKRRQG